MIRIAIAGYGNLGRGVEYAVSQNGDMKLTAIFTRRAPETVHILTDGVPVVPFSQIEDYINQVDVLVICGGSATDLPEMTPQLAEKFNVVDSFDNHSHVPEHIARVQQAAAASGHMAIVSAGWDPGLFSLARVYAQAALPVGESYTFWGPGLSQGHSDAIRRIKGVRDGRQYTIPVESAWTRIRSGEQPVLTAREKHTRQCWVVAEEGADLERIEREIKTMPGYFADYDTTVNFISQEELEQNHTAMPHGGMVIRSGTTATGEKHTIEFNLKLGSNPQFTSSILVACARAAVKMNARGESGCATMLEIRPCDLLPGSPDLIHAELV